MNIQINQTAPNYYRLEVNGHPMEVSASAVCLSVYLTGHPSANRLMLGKTFHGDAAERFRAAIAAYKSPWVKRGLEAVACACQVQI